MNATVEPARTVSPQLATAPAPPPPRRIAAGPPRVGRYLDLAPRLVSRVSAGLGLLGVLDAFFPHRFHALYSVAAIVPAPAKSTAEALVAVSGVLLLRIAHGLRQRKQGEWQVAVVLCLTMTTADLVQRNGVRSRPRSRSCCS